MDPNVNPASSRTPKRSQSRPAYKGEKGKTTKATPIKPAPENVRPPRLIEHPEFYCEQNPDVEPLIVPGMIPDTTPYEKPIGLCLNCRHKDDCTLPRPEGGVWHCEEYE